MPSLSRSLEQALHRAIKLASDRHHEYATLEHLLLALIDDPDAAQVIKACNVDSEVLRQALRKYVDEELLTLVIEDGEDAKPTTGFQRVVQRAVLHVQNSGRDEVTGANVLVALFTERESHAVYFLQEQNMTRLDAVSYISHGIAKRPGMTQQKPVRGADDEEETRKGHQAGHGSARSLLRQSQREGEVGPHRSADRPRRGGRTHHPDPLPPAEEQSAVRGRSGRRQDGHRRRPRAQDRQGRRSRSAEGQHDLCARHGRADRRHALSRRFRGAAEVGREGARSHQGRDPVHRRDPHRDRRRRHKRRRDGRVEPAEARSAGGHAALHRLDHLQGIPPVFREGPRARPPLPEDRRGRADRARHDQDHEGPQALFRGIPQGPLHRRRASRPRSNSPRNTSTTASCPTRRST